MTSTTLASDQNLTAGTRIPGVVLWTVQVVLALLFMFAGVMKLITPAEVMQAQSPDLSIAFLRFIGVAEVLGALGLVLPGLFRIRQALTPLAAAGLVILMAGAVVLTGTARPGPDGSCLVDLDGGGTVTSTDRGEGRVAVSVYPWEIAVARGAPAEDSTRNRVPAEVLSATTIGGRVRLGLAAGQPLQAEVTTAAVRELDLRPGERVTAVWKAAATRIVAGG